MPIKNNSSNQNVAGTNLSSDPLNLLYTQLAELTLTEQQAKLRKVTAIPSSLPQARMIIEFNQVVISIIVAALQPDNTEAAQRSAHLLYYLSILWQQQKIVPAQIYAELGRRANASQHNDAGGHSEDQLVGLYQRVHASSNRQQPQSYTASLLRQGISRIAQKVGEEGVETSIAIANGQTANIIAESADLLYHLTVLWLALHLQPAQIYQWFENPCKSHQ